MREKYNNKDFGVCPRSYCHKQTLLPVGITHELNKDFVRLYCCSCEDIYLPTNQDHRDVDGAYFGTTFPHLFLLQFPSYKPQWSMNKENGQKEYVPKIFGYRLHKTWHQRTIEATMGKYKDDMIELIENKEDLIKQKQDENELNYLRRLKEKQLEEMERLQGMLQKQEKDLKELRKV